MSIFSTRLKELRNKAELSQQELSKIIGISKSSINMYERGEREPGLEAVGMFADYFDVRTDYLLGKTDDSRSPKQALIYNKMVVKALESYRITHNYTRDQMEDLLDWTGMYFDLENGSVYGDSYLLKTVTALLSSTEKVSENKKIPPEEPKLTEGEEMLLELFRQVPEDKQELVLQMIRVALGR